eukprot:scaffold4277_cov405-Prasinococcus_capsulatus_cf.AAC.7
MLHVQLSLVEHRARERRGRPKECWRRNGPLSAGVRLALCARAQEWVTTVAYCQEDGRILSGAMDSTLLLWDAAALRSTVLTGHAASISQVGRRRSFAR